MLANLLRRSTPISELNNPNTPLYQALAGYELGGYGPAGSGAIVNTQTAMRIVAVLSCVRLIAETAASLSLGVYRRERRGRSQLRNPAERYLWGRPNPEMTRQVFWEAAFGTCVLTGNAFIYKVRDGTKNVAELWPINPRRVAVARDATSGEKTFTIDGNAYDSSDIMHIPGYGDGFIGLSPIGQARESLGLALAAEEFGSRFFGQGSTLSGILTTDQALDDTAAAKMAQSWKAAHTGVRNAHKVAILEGGLKWQQIGISPEDGQFLETRKFQVEEIARLFRVPPHMIGAIDKTTSWGTGIEQQAIGFVTYTLRPWLARFEQAITDELLGPADWYARWDVKSLLRGDTMQRFQAYQIARNIGVYNANEIREFEDSAPYDGGDDYAMPLNSAHSGDTPAATAGGTGPDGAGNAGDA